MSPLLAGTLTALGLSGAFGLVACTENPPVERPAEPTIGLLDGVLEAAAEMPERGAWVLAGVLAETSTSSLDAFARRAFAWAESARSRELARSLARVLADRGAFEALDRVAERRESDPELAATIVAAKARAGRLVEALADLEQLPDPFARGEAGMAVTEALVEARRLEKARALAETLEPRSRRDQGLLAIARRYAELGHVREGIEAARAIRAPQLRSEGEAAIAAELLRKGRMAQAMDIAKGIEARLTRAVAFLELARIAHRSPRARLTKVLMTRALEALDDIEDEMLASTAHVELIETWHALGEHERAWKVRSELPVGLADRVDVGRALAAIRRGDLEEARGIVAAIHGPALVTSPARSALAVLEARRGLVDEALTRADALLIPVDRWRTLGQVGALASDAPYVPERAERVEHALRDLP